MSARIILVDPLLAAKAPAAKPKENSAPADQTWMAASGGLLFLLLLVGVVAKLQLDKLAKKLKMEEFKNRELQKKIQAGC
jgi:flagellar biogenesis protein FliO